MNETMKTILERRSIRKFTSQPVPDEVLRDLAEAAMHAAMEAAGLAPEDVAYVNLHGTGTQANDAMEMKAVSRIFKDLSGLRIESTKPMTGHCLGAAGAVEAAICWLYLSSGLVKGAALSNSFAFGGSNACVALVPEGGEA